MKLKEGARREEAQSRPKLFGAAKLRLNSQPCGRIRRLCVRGRANGL